jgi:hypothetical protein
MTRTKKFARPIKPGLTLARKPGEAVILKMRDGTRVAVTLLRATNGAASIHFAAPAWVAIVRDELDCPDETKPAAA